MNISNEEYTEILKRAKLIDPINYMDIAHDYILNGKSMYLLKYDYNTVNEIDYTEREGTQKVCCLCNEVLPVAMFNITQSKGKKYLSNQCKPCIYKRRLKPSYFDYQKGYHKSYYKDVLKTKRRKDQSYIDNQKEYAKAYREANKDKIKADKREYYLRKKAEKEKAMQCIVKVQN